MEKHNGWIITAVLLFCLFSASCASHQRYPSEWGELLLPQGERCPDISGTYINLGESGADKSTYLSLLFDFEETPSTVAKVQIKQLNNERLEISCWNDEQKLVSGKDYSKGDQKYICSSKGVEIPIGKGEKTVREEGANTILFIVRSADGSLVIERKSSSSGYSLMYIPLVSGSYEWFRFKPADIRN